MATVTARSADEWEAAVSRSFVPLQVSRVSEAFDAAITHRPLAPGTFLSRVRCDSSELERSAAQAAHESVPSVLFVSHVSGTARVAQSDRTSLQRKGQSVMYVTHRPYQLSFPSRIDEVVLQIPIVELGLRHTVVEQLAARTFDATAPFRLVQGFLTELAASDASPADQQLARMAGELLSLALGSMTDHTAPVSADTALVAIRRFIRENAGDRSLDPSSLAAAFHVSRRQLYNVFRSTGETPAEAIRSARVERAAVLLRREPDRPIAQIAYESGFEDQSTFARAFAAVHGVSAAGWRRGGLAA
ncbi:AraC family transcriptional regulator [Rathayibacter sp. VKM Ac-2835]|uniref:AraC family transcriptional regulator n=1 Tax=Rathayibacter sp. VKM Ac-2835 TaxID=2739043 RepID=UPI001565108A|nr:AraC family transcriptional regulator [Rathayibacter sp. VKM Ac-2835]NRG43022.1 AraC family transcriptional regulator [Rathayibacter sp. VKM Ac-2835]